jgi:hypothetical protein
MGNLSFIVPTKNIQNFNSTFIKKLISERLENINFEEQLTINKNNTMFREYVIFGSIKNVIL